MWWCTNCGNLCECELTKASQYRCKGCGWIYPSNTKADIAKERK